MKTVILTMLGQDKPGIVQTIASVVQRHQGNWLASNFAHMGGHFTGFVEIRLPAEQLDSLVTELDQMPELNIKLVEAEMPHPSTSRHVELEVTGNDRAGIVQQITGALQQFDINILRFESLCESAPNWGSDLFRARFELAVSDTTQLDELQEAVENLANDLMVDVQWQDKA